jgi:hypothetical protein
MNKIEMIAKRNTVLDISFEEFVVDIFEKLLKETGQNFEL